MSGTKSRYIPALDGLRAFAVLAVIAYHLGMQWAPGGLLGVTVFFVLSGYLITSLLLIEWDNTETINLPQFWLRRVRRLMPAIVLVIVCTAALCALLDHSLLTKLRDEDRDAYNALCLDDERNRWWGYDYREDLVGELTEEYFLSVAREDFRRRQAVNFAVRLDGKLIGEAVLYHFDWRGGAELGCRIAPAYAGHGYGTEAFAAAAKWALYKLYAAKVVAKCYKENTASEKMLSSCMRRSGEDGTFYYFEKLV